MRLVHFDTVSDQHVRPTAVNPDHVTCVTPAETRVSFERLSNSGRGNTVFDVKDVAVARLALTSGGFLLAVCDEEDVHDAAELVGWACKRLASTAAAVRYA